MPHIKVNSICKCQTKTSNCQNLRLVLQFEIVKFDRTLLVFLLDIFDEVPIDGVGLQMHISIDAAPSVADIKSNMERLAALGLEIHITELDIRCGAPPAPACNSTGLELQANIYAHLLQTCLDVPACKSFETWGFTDK